MKILERYILREFLKLFALTLAGFVLVFIVVDLFENLDNLVRYHVPFFSSLAFFLYRVPGILAQVSPLSVLLSVLLSLGILARRGEITAVKASGLRLLRTLLPLFIAGLVISAALLFMNEFVTPAATARAEAIKRTRLGDAGRTRFGREGLWLRTGSDIINIRDVNAERGRLHGFTSYTVKRPFEVKKRMSARLVVWTGKRWVARRARVWDFEKETPVENLARGLVIEGLSPPEDFRELTGPAQRQMNIRELAHYIKVLETEGYDPAKHRTDLYSRVAFPLVNFIMVFLGIPFALKGVRTGGIAAGIGISVAVAFSYWIVFAVTTSLGSAGVLPPLAAALFPDVLFLAAGGLLLCFVRE